MVILRTLCRQHTISQEWLVSCHQQQQQGQMVVQLGHQVTSLSGDMRGLGQYPLTKELMGLHQQQQG